MPKHSAESWLARVNPRFSVKAEWPTHSTSSGVSESKTATTCEKTHRFCNVGAEDRLVHNFELNKDNGFANYETQHRANLMHPPANMTHMISIFAALLDRHDQRDELFQTSSSDSTLSWSQRPNQSWQSRWCEHSQNSWDQTYYHASWRQGS